MHVTLEGMKPGVEKVSEILLAMHHLASNQLNKNILWKFCDRISKQKMQLME